MAAEEKNEKRISSEEAFHIVGATLEKIDARLDNHAKQLANLLETVTAAATLIDILKTAVAAHQEIFEALNRAVAAKTGGEPPTKPGPVN
jgi:hypothetical protein